MSPNLERSLGPSRTGVVRAARDGMPRSAAIFPDRARLPHFPRRRPTEQPIHLAAAITAKRSLGFYSRGRRPRFLGYGVTGAAIDFESSAAGLSSPRRFNNGST